MVLTGNGINCERETAFACKLAGADEVEMVSIWDWVAGKVDVARFGMICFPGGFLDGDDLGSARACATRIKFSRNKLSGKLLIEELLEFVQRGGLIIGICNGFQLLVKLGILPLFKNDEQKSGEFKQVATLTFNECGRFEDRWVTLTVDSSSPCVFTRGLTTIDLPVRHGEGRLIIDEEFATKVKSAHLIPIFYADPVTMKPTEKYPFCPNGSAGGAAGLCDSSGRIFGLMPHPECFWTLLNHPDWSRTMKGKGKEGGGISIFRNAVEYIASVS
jgi:phosphoribosylformylglycinamidine synthase